MMILCRPIAYLLQPDELLQYIWWVVVFENSMSYLDVTTSCWSDHNLIHNVRVSQRKNYIENTSMELLYTTIYVYDTRPLSLNCVELECLNHSIWHYLKVYQCKYMAFHQRTNCVLSLQLITLVNVELFT